MGLCCRVYWDTRAPASDQAGLFFTQDDSGTVMEFAVLGHAITLRRQLPLQTLQKAIEGYSELLSVVHVFILLSALPQHLCGTHLRSKFS